jgi:hypothetical protein
MLRKIGCIVLVVVAAMGSGCGSKQPVITANIPAGGLAAPAIEGGPGKGAAKQTLEKPALPAPK